MIAIWQKNWIMDIWNNSFYEHCFILWRSYTCFTLSPHLLMIPPSSPFFYVCFTFQFNLSIRFKQLFINWNFFEVHQQPSKFKVFFKKDKHIYIQNWLYFHNNYTISLNDIHLFCRVKGKSFWSSEHNKPLYVMSFSTTLSLSLNY